MAWVPYDKFKLAQFNGGALDFDTGSTLKLALIADTYTPDQTNDEFWDDGPEANEVSGTGYTAGGEALANKSLDFTSHTLTLNCDNITFSQDPAGFTDARYAVLYNDSGTPATSRLVAYYDLASDRGNVAGDLVLQFPLGIFTV